MNTNLKPGDFVTLIPLGLPITLQYNMSGNLERVFVGYDNDRKDVTASMMLKLLDFKKVPSKITVQKGTTWVSGILYTNSTFKKSGKLPDVLHGYMEDLFSKSPNAYSFFAFNIACTSMMFTGHTHVMQTLRMSKFNVLPGWFVPPAVTNDLVERWVGDPLYTFMPVVTGMIIFRGTTSEQVSLGTSQKVVASTRKYVDDNGFIKIEVKLTDDTTLYMHYADAAKFSVGADTILYMDSHHQITYSHSDRGIHYDTRLTCSFCGRYFDVPESGPVRCQNHHCGSNIIPEIEHFLTVLDIPFPTPGIRDIVYGDRVNSISDFMLVEKMADTQITTTLYMLIRALVPVSVLPSNQAVRDFVAACAGSVDTVRYYAINPGLIVSDLGLRSHGVDRLISWFEDSFNVSELTALLDSDNVTIVEPEKRFNGAPIFRDKLIYITGNFIHDGIIDILRSYSAKITTVFTNSVDCVLIGGTNENIDGKSLNAAKNLGIPISGELAFFEAYDIDSDLGNLV